MSEMSMPGSTSSSQSKAAIGKTITLVVVIVPLVATAFAIMKLWQHQVVPIDLYMMIGLYLFTGFGITIGFHRLATHRSFKPHPVVEFILLAAGSMAVEGGVIEWVATHWTHHIHADKPGDPHSPLEGLFHAHVGWMVTRPPDNSDTGVKHLQKDKIAVFINRTFVFWIALGLIIPFLIDGWRGLLWGGLVRIFITHHLTWSVNSICHQFGSREFETDDVSRNQWFVGLFGLGEGWHNNHHAFPESAFHGMKWYQIDLSGYIIRLMEKTHLISGVRRISEERQAKKRVA